MNGPMVSPTMGFTHPTVIFGGLKPTLRPCVVAKCGVHVEHVWRIAPALYFAKSHHHVGWASAHRSGYGDWPTRTAIWPGLQCCPTLPAWRCAQ